MTLSVLARRKAIIVASFDSKTALGDSVKRALCKQFIIQLSTFDDVIKTPPAEHWCARRSHEDEWECNFVKNLMLLG